MGSRIRECPATIIECFCEVVIPSSGNESAWILQKFPETYNNEEMLKSVPEFAYPCEFSSAAVQHFSFVLTSIDSKWTFGYCRHAPNSQTCFVLLSYLPWHETFYKVLNQIAELANKKDSSLMGHFLESLYNSQVPEPGFQLRVVYDTDKNPFQCDCSDHTKLPSIPENRNLTEYFNAVDATNMIVLFASMLHERRILITSRRLSRLSACVQAANALIYPMEWQHIFIPVLPNHLLDYLSAPMPFLIGVPDVTLARVSKSELGEVVILDVDNNKVESPFKDVETLPSEIVSPLKRSLRTHHQTLGDGVSQAFLRALVALMGGYREALRVQVGERITFEPDRFLQSRPASLRPFLERMLQLQIFHQFIEGRLQILNSGKVNNDIFELEVNMFDDSSNKQFKQHYKYWLANMKKEGGALLKSMKSKANPAVRNAYKNVKDKGRKAYTNIQGRIAGMQKGTQDDMALSRRDSGQPRSAPASPTMDRKRPVTFQPLHRSTVGLVSPLRTSALETSGRAPVKSPTEPALDAVAEQSDETVSGGSLQRIDLDLMGDLQEFFSQCATTASLQIQPSQMSQRVSPQAPPEKQAFSDPSLHKVPLAPPPRKASRNASRPPPPSSEEPLIHLDSQDNEDSEPANHKPGVPLENRPVLRRLPVELMQATTQPAMQMAQQPPLVPMPPRVQAPSLQPGSLPIMGNLLPFTARPFAPPPYSNLQRRFQAVPYMGAPHPRAWAPHSTNPFLRMPWTPPATPPVTPPVASRPPMVVPISQPAPSSVFPKQQDPCADLIDL